MKKALASFDKIINQTPCEKVLATVTMPGLFLCSQGQGVFNLEVRYE
jgi:hypothetical protein